MTHVVNDSVKIPIRNDPEGYVCFTVDKTFIKFSHTKEIMFRVNVRELWRLLNTEQERYVMGGLEFFLNQHQADGIRMTEIEIMDPKIICDRALVSTFDLREKALYYFIG